MPAGAAGTTRGATRRTAPRSTLDRVLGAMRTRRVGPERTAAAVADWRTDSVFVVTTRPAPGDLPRRSVPSPGADEGPDASVRSFVVWWS